MYYFPCFLFQVVRVNWVSAAYLSFLLVEVIDDDADEQVKGEERAENDENDKVQIHVQVDLLDWLLLNLQRNTQII